MGRRFKQNEHIMLSAALRFQQRFRFSSDSLVIRFMICMACSGSSRKNGRQIDPSSPLMLSWFVADDGAVKHFYLGYYPEVAKKLQINGHSRSDGLSEFTGPVDQLHWARTRAKGDRTPV